MRRRKRPLAWVLVPLVAMTLVSPRLAADPLTNEDIETMHEAGLSASLIVSAIQSDQTSFNTEPEELIRLSQAGIPEEVLTAMTGAGSAPVGQTVAPGNQSGTLTVAHTATSAPTVASRFQGTPCQTPGIFVQTGSGLAELEASTYTQGKGGNMLLTRLTYGIKSMKSKAIIRGARSQNRVQESRPKFLFCFEESETGLSYETKGATNPSEFLLVALDVDQKKGHREFVAGKFNVWVGGQSGAPPKALRETTYKKLAPGVYEVAPVDALSYGEYAFYYAGSAPVSSFGMGVVASGGQKIFTFGTDL